MRGTLSRRGFLPAPPLLGAAAVTALLAAGVVLVTAGYVPGGAGAAPGEPEIARVVQLGAADPPGLGAAPIARSPTVAPIPPAAEPLSSIGVAPTAASDPADDATAAPTEVDAGFRLRIPYRSQFDGSTFEWGNCGVAAISMAMEFYGDPVATHDVRLAINRLTGNWDTQIGVDWRYLILALEQRGFAVAGPYAPRGGYLTWALEDVFTQIEQGRPVMLLLHYRSLPGHEEDEWIGDHYILLLGQTPDGRIVYHDPGFPGDAGAAITIERERLERAWSNTWIGQNRTAIVILPPD